MGLTILVILEIGFQRSLLKIPLLVTRGRKICTAIKQCCGIKTRQNLFWQLAQLLWHQKANAK
jgi:hypothetical protein